MIRQLIFLQNNPFPSLWTYFDMENAIDNKKVFFVSKTHYFDSTNGATVATRAILQLLTKIGYHVIVLTTTFSDSGKRVPPIGCATPSLASFTEGTNNVVATESLITLLDGMVQVYLLDFINGEFSEDHFFSLYSEIHRLEQPKILLFFGGGNLFEKIRQFARAKGSSVIFAIHNFNYHSKNDFLNIDYYVVPSIFASLYYSKKFNISCEVLPYIMDEERIIARNSQKQYVTFINPTREKGVYFFSRIAEQLSLTRPDIPLLVVESRGTEVDLIECGIDLPSDANLSIMSHTEDPKDFWSVTKILLLPSLWWESQPLVAVEAMMNSIPVIGSTRGGIPEVLGDAGVLLHIPTHYTQVSSELPSVDEVQHWVRAVVQLWDNSNFYQKLSQNSRIQSSRWNVDLLKFSYSSFFDRVFSHSQAR